MVNVVDIFSGVGGLSYGFSKDSFFNVLAANEVSKTIAKAYLLNHPKTKMYCCDIKDFSVKRVLDDAKVNKVDVLVGGAPCQAYSTIGKRLLDDPRGKLFKEYYRVLKAFSPSVFLFENVKGLISMRGGGLLEDVIKLFKSLGYSVDYKLLNAVEYGVPQIRERLFIVGTRDNIKFSFPQPLNSRITLKDALSDLPLIKTGEVGLKYAKEPQNDYQRMMRIKAPSEIQDHYAIKHNERLMKIMRVLPEGGSHKDIPEDIRPKTGYPNTYSRLWANRPSTTITRNLGTPSSSRCIHPKVARPLTTREGARLQSFPDDYLFYGTRSDKNLMIGKRRSSSTIIRYRQ